MVSVVTQSTYVIRLSQAVIVGMPGAEFAFLKQLTLNHFHAFNTDKEGTLEPKFCHNEFTRKLFHIFSSLLISFWCLLCQKAKLQFRVLSK